jgi:hypothetical protein
MAGRAAVIHDLDRYRHHEPVFEGMRVILLHRREPVSAPSISVVSGAAFRVHTRERLDVLRNQAMQPHELARLFGYEAELIPFHTSAADPRPELGQTPAERLPGMLELARAELLGGRPVLLWHAVSDREYDVVAGFDEPQGLLHAFGSRAGLREYETVAEGRAADGAVEGTGLVLVGERTSAYSIGRLERAALQVAVGHADDARCGLSAYDEWARYFAQRAGGLAPDGPEGSDGAYVLQVMAASRLAGTSYLRNLAWLYSAQANAHLDLAAENLLREAEAIQALVALFPSLDSPLANRDDCFEAVDLIARARARYSLAIDEMWTAVGLMGERRDAPEDVRRWRPPDRASVVQFQDLT